MAPWPPGSDIASARPSRGGTARLPLSASVPHHDGEAPDSPPALRVLVRTDWDKGHLCSDDALDTEAACYYPIGQMGLLSLCRVKDLPWSARLG